MIHVPSHRSIRLCDATRRAVMVVVVVIAATRHNPSPTRLRMGTSHGYGINKRMGVPRSVKFPAWHRPTHRQSFVT